MYFKKKSGIDLSYEAQGLIHFVSVNYKYMDNKVQELIKQACRAAGGEYYEALFELVTTRKTVTAIALKYSMSRETLYRCQRRYFTQMAKLAKETHTESDKTDT